MKRVLLFIFLVAGLSGYAQKDNHIVIGTIDTLYSKVLNESVRSGFMFPKGIETSVILYFIYWMAKIIFSRL
jgi:hypothetical protein